MLDLVRRKGAFFFLNIALVFLYALVLYPLCLHQSTGPLFLWHYSLGYLVYLAALILPALAFTVVVCLSSVRVNAGLFATAVLSFAAAEAAFRIVAPAPYADARHYSHLAPYVMFTGKPGLSFVWESSQRMGAGDKADRNVSMILRHLVSEFSVAPHRSVPSASVC